MAASNRKLKIGFFGRTNLFTKRGGDTYQIEETCSYVREWGHWASIITTINPDVLEPFDIIHLYNMTTVHEQYLLATLARAKGKRIVLTPIYHDLSFYQNRGRFFPYNMLKDASIDRIEHFRNLGHHFLGYTNRPALGLQRAMGYKTQQGDLLAMADALLCSSQRECEKICADFPGVDRSKCFVVPNFVNKDVVRDRTGVFSRTYGLKNYVLHVARLEDLKNQIALAHALGGTNIPVVFVGRENPNHPVYVHYFRHLLRRYTNLHYFPELSSDHYSAAFADARLHALPSWCETIGQVNLEALFHNCNTATTEHSYFGEYVNDAVPTLPPHRIEDLRDSLLAAYEAKPQEELFRRVRKHYEREAALASLATYYHQIA